MGNRSKGSGIGGSTLRTSGQIAKERRDKKASKKSELVALPNKGNVFPITGNKGSLSGYKLPQGVIAVNDIIPPQAKQILQEQFTSLGLPVDVDCLACRAEDRRATVKKLEDFAELLHRDASLLPRMLAAIKKCLKAATKSAEAQAKLIKASLKEQGKIDDAHADMLLALMGYNKKRNALELKLERKAKMVQDSMDAEARYHETYYGAAKQRREHPVLAETPKRKAPRDKYSYFK